MKEMQNDFSDIVGIIYCVGGPLNDNVLGYTNKQLVTFSRIAEIAKYQTGEPDDL